VFVMHVGRLDRPLEPPRWPWEVGLVAFEIARRHRFVGDLEALPDDIDVHVLPTGQIRPPRYTDLSQFRYRDTGSVRERIGQAYEASARYLERRGLGA
jgi:NTE family protein